jgi:hypothetical protein
MAYEIWDTDTANIVAARNMRDKAIALLREPVTRHGSAPILSLALIFEDDDWESTLIAERENLLATVRQGSQSAAHETPLSS